MGRRDDTLDGVDGAKCIGEMDEGDYAGPLGHQSIEAVKIQFTAVRDRQGPECCPCLLRRQLPWNNFGMMLHGGDEDLVPRAQKRPSVAVRHQVDAVSSAAGEYHLVRCFRVEETRRCFPRLVIGCGGLLAEPVDTSMDIGVLGSVKARDGIDHYLWLLSGSRIVEVDQRPAVDVFTQNREVFPRPVDIKRLAAVGDQRRSDGVGNGRRGRHRVPRRSLSNRSSSTRTGSSATSPMTSAAKAYVSSRSASRAGTPRLCA